MNEFVIDASSFILWSEVSFMEIIINKKLFLIILTKDVVNELKDEKSIFYLNEGIKNGVIRIVEVSDNEKEDIAYVIKTKLGIGEVSCIAFCMKERKIFITDDIKAKKRAEKINIKTFDTIEFIKEFIKDEDLLKIIREKFKAAYPKRFEEL